MHFEESFMRFLKTSTAGPINMAISIVPMPVKEVISNRVPPEKR